MTFSLFGLRNDREGAEASGIPRRVNRKKLARAELERELAAPASVAARVFSRYRRLLQVRRAQPAFHPSSDQRVFAVNERVFLLLRASPHGNERVLCLHSVANESVRLTLLLPGLPTKGCWLDLLSGQRHYADGNGTLVMELSPYQVLWARHE